MKPETDLEFSMSDFEANDTADMVVVVNGKPTTWKWTFAGPGHPKTVELNNRLSRERLHEDAEKEQSRVNGRKWKAPQESVDEARARNVAQIVDRLVGWTPVKIDGQMFDFSPENATKLLSDPRKVDLFVQALDFLSATASFTKASASS